MSLSVRTETRDRLIRSTHIIESSEHTNRRGGRSWFGFEIVTSHSREKKAYTSRVRRLEDHEGAGTSYVYDLHDETPNPLETFTTPTGRFSAATLQNMHWAYLNRAATAGTYGALVAWAEAQGVSA